MGTNLCMKRVKRDVERAVQENDKDDSSILIVPDENNMLLVHAIIVGPKDTPYEDGFFYFIFQFPPDYPMSPPKVTLKTTGGGKVRFNPNLYACGKVCLSILGTWPGPSWNAGMSLSSVLISIQAMILNEWPWYNEPGNTQSESSKTLATAYNDGARHETIRVAVLGMLEKEVVLPPQLRQMIVTSFKRRVASYQKIIDSNKHLDGKNMIFHATFCKYNYASLANRLTALAGNVNLN